MFRLVFLFAAMFSLSAQASLPCGSRRTPSNGSVNIFLNSNYPELGPDGAVIGSRAVPAGYVVIRVVDFLTPDQVDMHVELPIKGISEVLALGVDMTLVLNRDARRSTIPGRVKVLDGIAEVRIGSVTEVFECY